MENIQENINTKTLLDYKDIFKEFLDGKDIERIGLELNLSERTIKNYMDGSIPDSIAGKANESAILEKSLIILNEKKEKLSSI